MCTGQTKTEQSKNSSNVSKFAESIDIFEDRLTISLGIPPKKASKKEGMSVSSLLGNLTGGLISKGKDSSDSVQAVVDTNPLTSEGSVPPVDPTSEPPSMMNPPPMVNPLKTSSLSPPSTSVDENIPLKPADLNPVEKVPMMKLPPQPREISLKPVVNLPEQNGNNDPAPEEFPKEIPKPAGKTPEKKKKIDEPTSSGRGK